MPCVVTESSYFEDPFAPKAKVYSKCTSATTIEFFKTKKPIDRVKVRPCIQHILKLNNQIGSVRVFPSGENIIVGSLDSLFCVSELSKVEVSVHFDQNEYVLINQIDVHPSEVFVACNAPENSVRIVSTATGSVAYNGNKHRKPISSLFFAPSFNRICSASFDGTFIMSDLVRCKECCKYSPSALCQPMSTAAMRHDETVIAFGFSNGQIGLCDHRTDGVMLEMSAHPGWINSIDFCATDYYFSSCGNDRSLKIWDLRNPEEAVRSDAFDYSLKKVLWMNDGRFFCVANDGTVTSRSVTDDRNSPEMAVGKPGILACDIDLDSRMLLYSGEDMTLSAFHY